MTTLQKFASSYVDDGGGYGWTSPDRITAADSVYAYTQGGSGGASLSNWLLLGFNFSAIAEGTVISGISVTLHGVHKSMAGIGGYIEVEYWDGTAWKSSAALRTGSTATPADYTLLLPEALSREVIAGWTSTGLRIRHNMQPAGTVVQHRVDAVSVTVTYVGPDAPTATAISPSNGSAAGGTVVTITGTNFQFNGQDVISAVTVGGVACTEVSILSGTELSCVVGAHAAGAVDVVVTSEGGSGTLTNGYTYLTTVDSVVKVVKGGVVSGSNLASAALWPSSPAEQVYGGPTELWDSLTVANVNASTFGFVISATVGTGAEGRIDYAAARFHYTVTGLGDPASYLAVLRVASDRQTARPELYQLPRSGFAVANDPSIDRRVSAGAEFRTVRRFAPGRNVEKIWHSRELWLDESVQGNTPGLQVFAKVDDGPEFQLRDGGGTAVTLRGTGPKEVFFPKGDQARGRYMQLIYRVPALGTGQVAAAYAVREGATHLLCRPKKTWSESFTLVLGAGEFEDRTSQRASGREQLERLIALSEPGRPAIAFREPNGRTGYCSVTGLEWREAVTKDGPVADTLLANITLRMARYE